MATINLGKLRFNWKGTYDNATAYTKDDVVEYNGSSYVNIQNSTGNLPTDTAYWEVMAQQGNNASITEEVFTATAGQTTFNATYTVGKILVFLNGVKLKNTTDFTATNGTSISLTTGASLNDVLEIVKF